MNIKKTNIGSYLARHHIFISILGLCAVAIVQWQLFTVVSYQTDLSKDEQALRLIDSCSNAFSSALLCSDLVLSGGNTYLSQTAVSYVEETQKCLNKLKEYEILSPVNVGDFETDFKQIIEVVSATALISHYAQENSSSLTDRYYQSSDRVVDFLTSMSDHAQRELENRKNKAAGYWKFFFVLTLVVSLAFFLIILATWRRQTRILAHPIQRLAEHSRNAVSSDIHTATAEFSVSTSIAEIDDLRRDFTFFAEKLFKNQQELEGIVRARTVELSQALDVAVQASDTKTVFLANMSHELRTPLNAIIGYSELSVEELQELPPSPELEEIIAYIQQINKSGLNLLNQINDVLDISKIETGKVDLDIEIFELDALLSEVESEVRVLAQKNNNQLESTVVQGSILLKADRGKVRQVLINLLGNACKFTSEGKVKIAVLVESPPNERWVNISVSDSGIGIDSQDLEGLFEPYEQRGSSIKHREKGTGLGLAISRRLCQLHGGNILVESELGVGSTFTMRLPVAIP